METVAHTHEARKEYAPAPDFRGDGVIQTYSGAAYNFADPDPATIKFEDIAHALSNMCRFAGHVRRFYSVAEHSVFVSMILEAEGYGEGWQRAGLLHDAHEAYVWDAPRPFKPLLGGDFKRFADLADAAIGVALDVSPVVLHHHAIKHADDRALVTEARLLMHHGTDGWSDYYQELESVSREELMPGGMGSLELGLLPEEAKRAFCERARVLGVVE